MNLAELFYREKRKVSTLDFKKISDKILCSKGSMLNMSSTLNKIRMDFMFHVYDKKTKECVYNCLTIDDLESKIIENQIRFSDHEIERVMNDSRTIIDSSH